ncbi:MAG: TIGR04255 family protein [Mariprofundus sp.]|nr:TIGR04255 family protein [Mariprofundus sp.]
MNYNEPTIIEALCEFRFAQSDNWDSTIYGAFWNQIQSEYPNKEERKQISLGIKIGPDGQQGQSVVNENAHMLFKSDNGKSLVQLQPNLLTVNVLEPYQGWGMFKPKISAAYEEFGNVGSFSLERVGLRYVNRMPELDSGLDYSHWLSKSPYVSEVVLNHLNGVHSMVSVPIDENRLSVTVATESPQGGALFVDIDSSRESVSEYGAHEIGELLDVLHYNLIEAYETLATNELRKVMGVKDV